MEKREKFKPIITWVSYNEVKESFNKKVKQIEIENRTLKTILKWLK